GVAAVVALLSWPGLLAVGCAGVVIALRSLIDPAPGHRRQRLGWALAANAPWLLVFGWQYFTVMQPVRGDPLLRQFWRAGYPPSWHALGSWLRTAVPALISDPLSLQLTGLVFVLVIVGGVTLWVEHGWASLPAVLLVPVTIAA